ncbi:hypothetical protein BJ322DRAFT_1102529 [Thelephora terrestris]|uniref:Uncharacterized protein n=1 Tax=Thelephora terrestris TaxID=56493 RepID=A0A9P6L9T4_9AGAM|nr:hypothetical protein BJ322DRAFT_1105030 [Thelephora terrestris]KAF9791993.1 hypothetical protein BJ322DRAFT_1102529 [Thelephora terrestris]
MPIRVYRSGARKVAKKNKAGQGFEGISLGAERRLLNKAVAIEFGIGHLQCSKVLSHAAKALIRQDIQNGKYSGMEDRREPPSMAPSDNPDDYSVWCSLCNDFGEFIILCSKCRVGICSTNPTISTGCLEWKPIVHEADFIFTCPFCVQSGRETCLLPLRRELPHAFDIWYRYDPAVLIIGATWHQNDFPFVQLLQHALSMSYYDGHRLVLRMDVPLDTIADETPETPVAKKQKSKGKLRDDDGPVKEVIEFLTTWQSAKIVVVIETHCLETGVLVWRGDEPANYETCSLNEILSGCIPAKIFEYLSNRKGSLKHQHRSLILNLSCGPSVSVNTARASLLEGHCADAVLSFADSSNVVGELATRLLDITSRWVRSASTDFDVIMASTIDAKWALDHKPVISTQAGHVLYTKARITEPGGKVILCHRRCGALLHYEPNSHSTSLKVTCTGCWSTCTVKCVKLLKNNRLGRSELVRVDYPQEQFPTEWTLPQSASEQGQPTTSLDSAAPANTQGHRPIIPLPSRARKIGSATPTRGVSPAISNSSATSILRSSSTSTSRPSVPSTINRSPSLPILKQSRSVLKIKLPPATSSSPSSPMVPTPPATESSDAQRAESSRHSGNAKHQTTQPERKKKKKETLCPT